MTSPQPHRLHSAIANEDLTALCANEAQNLHTTKARLHALSMARWRHLMYVRETFAEHRRPPAELDSDIMSAFDPKAWSGIDRRIAKPVKIINLIRDLKLPESRSSLLWRFTIATICSLEAQNAYEDCVSDVSEMMAMRDQMKALQMDTSIMDRNITDCFQVWF